MLVAMPERRAAFTFLICSSLIILAVPLVLVAIAYYETQNFASYGLCNPGLNNVLRLPWCQDAPAPAVSGKALVVGRQGFKNAAFVKALAADAGFSLGNVAGEAIAFNALLESQTSQLLVNVLPPPNNSYAIDLNVSNILICNVGENAGDNLPACPQNGLGNGSTFVFGNTSEPGFVFGRRLNSPSSALIIAEGAPGGEIITFDLNSENATFGDIVCNSGNNTGLSLAECPVVGNDTGVPLLFGNASESDFADVKRIAAGPDIRVYATSNASPVIYIDYAGLDFCNISCAENFVVNIHNSQLGYGVVYGFGHTFTEPARGSAILSGELSLVANANFSTALAGRNHEISGGTGNAVPFGTNITISNCSYCYAGGLDNIIQDSEFCAIFSAESGLIANSVFSTMFSIEINSITDSDYSTNLGGDSISSGADRTSSLTRLPGSATVSGVEFSDTANVAHLKTFGSLRTSSKRTVPGGTTVTLEKTDFMFIIQGGVGNATVELPPNPYGGFWVYFRIVGSTNLVIQATGGAELCSSVSSCAVNGSEYVTTDNASRYYIKRGDDGWNSFN